MKRVNLLAYSDLAETLYRAHTAWTSEKTTGGHLYFSTFGLPNMLRAFIAEDNGFSTCKHVATDLAESVDAWFKQNIFKPGEGQAISANFDEEFEIWAYRQIGQKVETFRSVFSAECRDVEIYSVEQVSIYKTSTLVSSGSDKIPSTVREKVPLETLREFDEAGKCLAFDLPTACGFHSLRALELMMDKYLADCSGEAGGSTPRTWNDYIKAFEALEASDKAKRKPSKKVVAMLDRMRQLDRNPLMHPRDTLDTLGADMLFNLCAITIVEMARDLIGAKQEMVVIEGGKSA